MLVSIGSRSLPKISAITKAFSKYPELWINASDKLEYVIMPKEERKDEKKGQEKDEFSSLSCNPLTLEETIQGAKNRAKKAFEYANEKYDSCDFGVGIEAGMYPVAEADTKYMDASVCSIYDGTKFYIGISPSFEYPQKVVDRVLNGEELGYMSDVFGPTAKGRKGTIGVLTDERIFRDDFEEQAVMMALMKIISKDIYFEQ